METILNKIECRVFGSLIEKELATPEYYPLTLNSLTAACNQKSNRHPVMNLEESEVVRALDSLKLKQLVLTAADGGRVPKYRHRIGEKLSLEPAKLAIIAELLVRGPQTVGELRGRTERMASVGDIAAIETILQDLTERNLVTLLPRQPGRKEQRYGHLFSGQAVAEEEVMTTPEPARIRVMEENERLFALEEDVRLLRGEVAELREALEKFRAQFE